MHRACRRAGVLALIMLSLAGVQSAWAATRQAKALRSLKTALRNDLLQAGGHDGVLVVDDTTHKTLFSDYPNTRRLPASVEKLYTTTTALLKFGARATLRTSVYGSGSLATGGAWDGNLYLRGGGDPTFGSAAFDRAAYRTGATVQALVKKLAATGISSLDGRIIGDESYFDARRGTPATGYRPDLEVEGELSGLSFDAGFTNATETALQPHPARFAAHQFAAALRSGGVKVPKATKINAGITPAGARLLAYVPSPTIATLIRLTNAPSDNYFAETLVKDLGARFGGGGSTAAGASVVRSFIAGRFGLHPVLNDGSGLSRADGTSPAQVVSLLQRMQSSPYFMDSLAIAGVSGTMQDEMTGTRAADNCRGKTGTLHDVANLAGYCTARNGDRLVFAFLFNGQTNALYGHEVEDKMGTALANYNP